jgi:hypothetical protein
VLQNHVKKTMEKGLYQLEDGELVPEPTLETKYDLPVFLLFSSPIFSCDDRIRSRFMLCGKKNYLYPVPYPTAKTLPVTNTVSYNFVQDCKYYFWKLDPDPHYS